MRVWNSLMAVVNGTAAGGAQTYYPDSSSVTTKLWGSSVTAGDSDVVGTEAAAIVYEISFQSVGAVASEGLFLELHDGTIVAFIQNPASRIPARLSFGPNGIKLPTFRIRVLGTSLTDFEFAVTWERVEA